MEGFVGIGPALVLFKDNYALQPLAEGNRPLEAELHRDVRAALVNNASHLSEMALELGLERPVVVAMQTCEHLTANLRRIAEENIHPSTVYNTYHLRNPRGGWRESQLTLGARGGVHTYGGFRFSFYFQLFF